MQSLETLTERDFDSVWEIMEESFPRDERRSREAQRKILDVSWYHLYGYLSLIHISEPTRPY